MRFVVYGAGGIGGVIGARLHQAGHEVVLIARGAHFEAIRDRGLRFQSPDEDVALRIPIADHPGRVAWHDDDVVVLAMKSQDTQAALRALAAAAPSSISVACAQNGVANERAALRYFPNVYGICVMCPTNFLTPGAVQAYSAPTTGILDTGRYPSGVDETAERIAAALSASTFVAEARPDIMRWKHTKLLMNLANSVQALCGNDARAGDLVRVIRREGEDVLRAAGVGFASREEDRDRRGDLLSMRPVGDGSRGGGSTWQSLMRGAGTVETDYLNGEIVLLGRLHGVPTPANELMQRLMREAVRDGLKPGAMTPDEILGRIALR